MEEKQNLEDLLRTRFNEVGVHVEDAARLIIELDKVKKKHSGTNQHLIRVGLTASYIAKYSGYNTDIERELLMAGLIHDIGKIDWPVSLLDKKTGDLSEEENRLIREHPEATYRYVKDQFAHSAEIALRHHMHQKDGYPERLPERKIPFNEATMRMIEISSVYLAIADSYDAFTYRLNNGNKSGGKNTKGQAKQKLLEKYPDKHNLINYMYEMRVFGGQL